MNRDQIIDDILSLITEVEEGNESALKTFIELKKLTTVIEAASDQIKESAIKEAKQEGAKTFDKYGVKIEVKEGSARFDFKGVPQWVKLMSEVKAIEEVAKHRARNTKIVSAEETGEEIPAAKMTFTSETIAITLPKA